jgi:TRAP-type C4-dicarboxylate transport system substrate-binding protein
MLPPYQVLTRKPIGTLSDLEGQKLRSGGNAQDLTIKALGAVAVHMGGADVYEALSRKTLDGAVFPLQSAIDFRLTEVLKAATKGQNFGGFATTYAISLADWGKLPDDVKKVMEEAGEATVEHACAALDSDDHGPAVERMTEQGVTVSELPDDVAKQIKAKLGAVNEQWAAALDKRGLPGTEVLHAFLDALAKK